MALDNGAKRGGRDGRKAAAREKVFELRLAGVPFRAIGKEVGVSHTYAMRLYREALSERSKHVEELKDLHVTVELERLDKLILAHWPNRSHPQHAAVILRCLDTKAKLLGLHAPTKVEHAGVIGVETVEDRRRRIMEEAADDIANMTPEQLAAAAAALVADSA